MAKHTLIKVIDDIDGTEGATTVRFAHEGRQYEIDLAEANAAKLRDLLAPFIGAARKAGARPGTPPLPSAAGTKRTPYDRDRAVEIREWARKNGFPHLSDKGRIPGRVVEAWEKNQGPDPDPMAGLQAEHDAFIAKIDPLLDLEAGLREALARGEQGPAEILDEHERDHCPDLDHCPQHGTMVALDLDPDTHNVRAIDSGGDKGKAKPQARAKPIKHDAPLPTDENIMKWVRENAGAREVKRTSPTPADRRKFIEAHTTTSMKESS